MASLAGLLGELKERSGLSYGELAKQLGIGTSTVHRYCNGDAVPTEFAVVRRMARICGATPQELVEVHRRWVLADAYRGRKAEPAAAAGAAPEFESASRPAVSSAPEAAAAHAGQPAAARHPQPAAANDPQPTAAEPAPEPETLSSPGSVPRSSPRPPTRRRRTLVLAAAIAAVVAIGSVALALNGSGDGDGDKDTRIARPTAPPELSASPSDPRGKSADKDKRRRKDGADGKEKSKGKPRGKGEPHGKDEPHGTDKNGAPSAPGPRKGNSAPGALPGSGTGPGSDGTQGEAPDVALTARTRPYAYVYQADCSQSFLVNRGPAAVPEPPARQDVPAWVGQLGAVAVGEQFVEVTLQGTGEDPVVVKDINIRVQHTGAPPSWNNFLVDTGCGEAVETKSFDVDLDAATPRLTPREGQGDFPYRVSENDPLVFYVGARAKKLDVRWYVEVEWSHGGRHGTLRIDDQGKPFRTSGLGGRPTYNWGDAGEWVRGGQREDPLPGAGG